MKRARRVKEEGRDIILRIPVIDGSCTFLLIAPIAGTDRSAVAKVYVSSEVVFDTDDSGIRAFSAEAAKNCVEQVRNLVRDLALAESGAIDPGSLR